MRKAIILIVSALLLVAIIVIGLPMVRAQAEQKQVAAMSELETEAAFRDSLTAQIGATGAVRSKQTANLIWQTSGTIELIDVYTNDMVTKGQVLAVLDRASLSQNVIQARADLINTQQQLADLYENIDLDSADARLEVIKLQSDLDDLIDDRERMEYPRCYQETIDDYFKQWDDAKNRVQELEDQGATYDVLSPAKGIRDTAFANYNYCTSPRPDSELNQADAEIELAQANLKATQERLEDLEDGEPDANEVAALEARIEAIQATLAMTELKAPFAGTITSTKIKPGDQVSAGTTAFRIDDLSQLLVDVQISEIDINQVAVGQEAVMTFDAIIAEEYHGVVTEITTVGESLQGVVEFTVTISITDPDEAIKPGMTAIANIVIEEFDNVLLIPNRAVRVEEGKRIVYLMGSDGIPYPVEIELGSSSNTHSEVMRGEVEEGDLIVINPPEILFGFGPPDGSQGGMFGRN
ncbi:MAG: efflux RND transporter periplasmic adaptor subunit [Anaerolineaceae bacterium]|nr:efflux RND transporter periplasmic adaptor subunit [Anaerolineaceae bacterium]